MLSWLNDWIWIQQDYLWFVAGIGWLFVALRWWQGRRANEIPAWVPWSAGTGMAITCIQIFILVTPMELPVPYRAPCMTGDMCLGFVLAIYPAGLWWVNLAHSPRGRIVACTLAGLLLATAAWRYTHPLEGSIITAAATLAAMGWWTRRPGRGARAWIPGLAFCAVAVLLDTTGPVFSLWREPQRWWDFNPMGPWSAFAHGAAAMAVFAGCRRGSHFRDEPKLAGVIAVWLAGGLGFAIAVGAWGRQSFERNAVGRVSTTVALMPKDAVEILLDDRFQIGEPKEHHFTHGGSLLYAESPHAATHGAAVHRQLTQISRANRDLHAVLVTTLRNGWLVTATVSQPNEPPRTDHGKPTLLRRATRRDERSWEHRVTEVVGPVVLTTGDTFFARAPLVGPSGAMLGWLVYDFAVSQWIAAQAQPRALTYIIVALGLIAGHQRLGQLRRARERDNAQAHAAALAQANDLKTTFLAKVSHELRTPLQSFLGYTELMLPEATDRDRARLLAMREHAALMSRLVNDLIDLSAAECGKFQLVTRPIALADLVTQAVESLRPAAEGKGLTYTIDIRPGIPAGVEADPQRVRQVVLNLVGNAVKFTDRGLVTVLLACTHHDAATATIELRVTDTGPGIAAAAQAGLFTAFARLAPTARREGSGLGLAIVAAVSRAMGGDVTVVSDGHTGSTFITRWKLPVTAAPSLAAAPRVSLHGKKILVADDNALVRDLFIAYLSACGAECTPATDGVDVIDWIRRASFDAIVLDLAMPRLDGFATARQLRRESSGRTTRIVGVSAHAGGPEHQAALAAGMDAFLTKPVALPDLARALAPAAGWIPSEPAFAPVRAEFEERFRADARTQGAALIAALILPAWPEVARLAHHLRNSAGVVGDASLARACAALEHAARSEDSAAAASAWTECEGALAIWCNAVQAHTPPSIAPLL